MVLLDRRIMQCAQHISGPNIHLQVKYDQQVVCSFSLCGFPTNFVGGSPIYIYTCDSVEENVWTSFCDGYDPSVMVLFWVEIKEEIDSM